MFLSLRINLNFDDYMGVLWVQNEVLNFIVLNFVNIYEYNLVNNSVLNFLGNGNYLVSYDNSVFLFNVYLSV